MLFWHLFGRFFNVNPLLGSFLVVCHYEIEKWCCGYPKSNTWGPTVPIQMVVDSLRLHIQPGFHTSLRLTNIFLQTVAEENFSFLNPLQLWEKYIPSHSHLCDLICFSFYRFQFRMWFSFHRIVFKSKIWKERLYCLSVCGSFEKPYAIIAID